VGVPTIKTGPMTVEEFYDLTDTGPDNEKWELIDGEPILNASPSPVHQWIAKNLSVVLANRERELKGSWAVLPGLGVRVSRTNLPEPDLLIMPRSAFSANPSQRDTGEMILAFEILSPSTMDRDLRWKKTADTDLPSLTHYVVVAQDAVDVVVFTRDTGFAEPRYRSLPDTVESPELGIAAAIRNLPRHRTGIV
jgi:Uma2 family endonuclease